MSYAKDARGQSAHSNVITLQDADGEIALQHTGLKQDSAPLIAAIEKSARSATLKGDATNIITLDVREDLRVGREPFQRIMEAVGRLRDGERLRVVAPFEPRPLIGVLAAQGFTATISSNDAGDFEVIFSAPTYAEGDEETLL